ncbi:MAG: radical SAM protein [Selenomonadaceae bacterium]|nr:radical SAM protein [Selenomonadaceae bacterium]
MPELDILFLNLHRRYLSVKPMHGGFLGIYLLSAFLNSQGYSAKGFAGTLEEGLRHIDNLCGAKKISMLGLYCDYENVTENIFLSRYVKEKYNLPVIVGGPQATALTEKFFTDSQCDAVVRYEGELTVLELMNYFLEDVGELENILGITYLTADGLKRNAERPLIKNLDALPFIDADCYLESKYFYSGLSLMTGRGCPFHCAFCHEGAHTRQVRFRSVENVLAEIDAYLKVYNKFYSDAELYILFTDDTFTLNTARMKKLCDGLAERQKVRPFKFFCEGHIHTIYKNPEMIHYLVKAGCERIQLGIEAGTEKVLKAYGKNTTPDEIFEVIRLCRDEGIKQIYGNIILGSAHFTREIYEADRKFARQLLFEGQGVVELGVVTFWPLAETKMTRLPKDFGIKICDDEFLTSVGDFPQTETNTLDRFDIAEMAWNLQEEIFSQMIEMIENRQVPLDRILSWFPAEESSRRGFWYHKLTEQPILYSYYKMIQLKEGFPSEQIENLPQAHPLRVITLNKYLRKIDAGTVEIRGEKFCGKEIDVLLLTTGKLSVEEIARRVDIDIAEVMKVLNRMERRHLIVYALH